MSELVQVDRLCVQLGRHDVLRNVTFSAGPGDLVAVLGPNGSGKSTLLKTMLGLQPAVSGSVTVTGRSPDMLQPGTVGYVPQIKTMDRSFPSRAVELVVSAVRGRWPGRVTAEDRDRAELVLRRVGAVHLADRPVSGLSGGELQRIYLARALVRKPRLLLLDEPEAGIDAAGTSDLHHLLDGYRNETDSAVLIVTHDWDLAFHHATRVLLLRTDQVSFGPPDEALREECVRAAFGHVGHAHKMLTAGHRHA